VERVKVASAFEERNKENFDFFDFRRQVPAHLIDFGADTCLF
jgi:hypothetical protein